MKERLTGKSSIVHTLIFIQLIYMQLTVLKTECKIINQYI